MLLCVAQKVRVALQLFKSILTLCTQCSLLRLCALCVAWHNGYAQQQQSPGPNTLSLPSSLHVFPARLITNAAAIVPYPIVPYPNSKKQFRTAQAVNRALQGATGCLHRRLFR
jgi:hypothetical protein